jgi:hypothetical protein
MEDDVKDEYVRIWKETIFFFFFFLGITTQDGL